VLYLLFCFFFFFKQKTAYEIMPSLVGSEMCIRDRADRDRFSPEGIKRRASASGTGSQGRSLNSQLPRRTKICLLYTSDAADDLHRVDRRQRQMCIRDRFSSVWAAGCSGGRK